VGPRADLDAVEKSNFDSSVDQRQPSGYTDGDIITVLVGYNIGIPLLLEVRVHVWVAQSVMRS
jgi:hypothetical protein